MTVSDAKDLAAIAAAAYRLCRAGGANVQQELWPAMQYRKPILPLRLAETDFPEGVEYILAARQYVDLLDLKQEQWLPEVLRALALLADEREQRIQGDRSAEKTELVLARAGLSNEQIAVAVGKNYDAVRKTITRARAA